MNFLDLCKRTRQEMGYSGTGPASVQGQVGEMGRLVNKVSSAWLEIQQARSNWRFMLKTLSAPITAGTLLVADLKEVDPDSFVIVEGGVSYPLRHTTKDIMRTFGSMTERPTHFRHERGALHFYPIPNRSYNLIGDYYKSPTLLALENTAVPSLPEEYHEAIFWLATKQLGAFEESGNTYSNAVSEYRRIFTKMLDSETPDINFGGPMA